MKTPSRVAIGRYAYVALGLGCVAFGAVLFRHRELEKRRPHDREARATIGKKLFTDKDMAVASDGTNVPLAESTKNSLVVVVDGLCIACRLNVRSYAAMSDMAKRSGVKVLYLMKNDSSMVAQYGRLIGESSSIYRVSVQLMERLHLTAFPTTFSIEKDGIVSQRWNAVPDFKNTE